MIKRITDKNIILMYEKNDLFSLRIKSLANAYGTQYDFAAFYAQLDSDNKCTAVLSSLDRDFTVSHNIKNISQFDEISEFICAVGYSSVLTDDSFVFKNTQYNSHGVIMTAAKKPEYSIEYAVIDEYPKLMDIFNLDNYESWDFEAWYVDLSHRIRHGTAKAYSLNINNQIVTSAVFSSIYDGDAILSSVYTEPAFRKKGYGKMLVSYMLCDIKGRVHLMREADKNENFYKSLGFVNNGIWRIYK